MDMIHMLFPLFYMFDDYEGNNCRSQDYAGKGTVKAQYL